MKKTLSIFVIALFLFAPMTTNAGLFDFFNNFKANQPAQVIKSSDSFERGDKDEKILEVQTILKDQGIYDGWLSGAFGPKTEAAIRDFQSKNGLNTTGVLDQKTYEYMVGGTEKDNNSRGGGQSGNGSQPLTALEAMCNQNNPLWIKVLSPSDNAQYASNYVAQPVFALCQMTGLGADRYMSISMEYNGIDDVLESQENISNTSLFNVTNPYPNIWYIEYLPGIDFANDYEGDGEYEIHVDFHNDVDPGIDAMDEVSIQVGGGQQNNINYGTSACGMEVLTPNPGVNLYGGQSNTFTTLVKIENIPGQICSWGEFEGMIGNVQLIDTDSNIALAVMEVNGQPTFWQNVSIGDPQNAYTTDRYFVATLQFINPLPTTISNNLYLHFTENNEGPNGPMPNPDQLFMPINVVQ